MTETLILFSIPFWSLALIIGLIQARRKRDWRLGMKALAATNLIQAPFLPLVVFISLDMPGWECLRDFASSSALLIAVYSGIVNTVIFSRYRKHTDIQIVDGPVLTLEQN